MHRWRNEEITGAAICCEVIIDRRATIAGRFDETGAGQRTPLERLFRPLIERSEKYRRVATAVESYGSRIAQQYEEASAKYVILKEDARAYEREFVRQNPGTHVPRPQFTVWEISKLELQALKETDPALREDY